MSRVKWVDGLRGSAATLVAFGHYFNGEFPMLFRTYWTNPPEDNQRLVQLPPINLLWSMNVMVPLFYVISGYVVAMGLLGLRDGQSEQFTDRLRSSAIRRFVRLTLPLTGLAIICQIIFFCGLFIRSLPENSAPGLQPWTSPWGHLRYLGEYLADSLQLFQFQYNHGLSQQMWTIPLDLRGSFAMYFVIFVQVPWRPKVRLGFLSLLLSHTLWYGIWDVFSMMAGLSFAELSALYARTGYNPRFLRGTISYVLRLALAAYLGSLNAALNDYPPDFRILGLIQPWKWSFYSWDNARLTWNALGAVLLFSVLMQSPRLQRMFSLQPFQYLGKLSFSIYLVHTPIYQIIRSPLRDSFWALQERRGCSSGWSSFMAAYTASGVISYTVVFFVAWWHARYIDPQVGRVSRNIDVWLSQGKADVQPARKKSL